MLIALDSNILIYFFNENPEFVDAARRLLSLVQTGEVTAVASVLVLGEIMRKGNDELCRALTSIRNLDYVSVDAEVALKAADLQQVRPSLRFVDALHIATAVVHGAQEFWTNDRHISTTVVPGLTMRALDIAAHKQRPASAF